MITTQKLVFLAGNADWLSELPTVIKQYIITIDHSKKKTPVPASKNRMKEKAIEISKTIEKFKNQIFNLVDSSFVQLILNVF